MQDYPAKKIRNIAIMGHGGTGKTQLAEAMLFQTKAIDRMGKSQDGNTVTDFSEEEIQKGSSINTAYAFVEYASHKVNIIDTPGDFDFLADQQLALAAADIVVLVDSAKDTVSVGSEKVFRLATGKKPLVLILNRMDEANADFFKAEEAFAEQFGNRVQPLFLPIMEKQKMVGLVDVLAEKAYKIDDKGKKTPCDIPADLQDRAAEVKNHVTEQIAEADEALLEKFFADEAFTQEEIEGGIKNALMAGTLIPALPCSALQCQGVEELLQFLVSYGPSPEESPLPVASNGDGEELTLACDEGAPLAAFVFKTVIDSFVGRVTYFRVFQGTMSDSTPIYNARSKKEERNNGIFLMRGKKQFPAKKLVAGDIGAAVKLSETLTNDTISSSSHPTVIKPVSLPVPSLKLCIRPVKKGEDDKIMQGLQRLKDEDPSFDIVNNQETRQLVISGQGAVQLEVLKTKLKNNYKVDSELSEIRVPYRETIRKKVKVQGKHKKQSGGHGQYGDVWVVFEPTKEDTDQLVFAEEVFGGAVPKNYFPAVQKGLEEAVEEGVLAGYPVVNLKATLVDGSYHEVDSNELSFKIAAKLAYKAGLPQADPIILEPIASVKVFIPDSYTGDIMGDISKRRGRIMGTMPAKKLEGFSVIEAEAPESEMTQYATDLKSMTQGRGWFVSEFARYEAAPPEVAQKVIQDSEQRKAAEE